MGNVQVIYDIANFMRRYLNGWVGSPKNNVLVYGHQTTRKRHWVNAASFACLLERAGVAVEFVRDMASFSVQAQCELFFHAGWIVSAHGGQMGNVICARSGTVIVELACK